LSESSAPPRASIVLPVYRQADHIEGAIAEFVAALNSLGASWELILVVNGPHDGTDEACQRAAGLSPHIRVVRPVGGSGWGAAVREGIRESRGEIVCFANSARTTAADLSTLVGLGLRNPEVVLKTTRKLRDSWRRRVGSVLYNLFCRARFDLSFWDINGTPKVFPRAFDPLLALTRNDDLLDVEFMLVCHRRRYLVLEVPVYSISRRGGRSTTSLKSAVRMFYGAWTMGRAGRGCDA
jgi:glycosyltransferase involved in cell wall biosynthesis